MAQSARLSEGVTAPRIFAPQPRNDRDASPRNLDWDLARVTKANLLLVGAEKTVSSLVFAMWSLFDGPILVRRRPEPLSLPQASHEIGTLILHGVDTLTHEEQGALYQWLTERTSRTRVVSTSAASLLPLV